MSKKFITSSITTKFVDKGAKHILKEIDRVGQGIAVTVGIHSARGVQLPRFNGQIDGRVPIAQYAYWQEYGTVNIPPRPFLSSTMDDRAEQFGKSTAIGMRKLYRGQMGVKDLLKIQGQRIRKWTKSKIWTLRTPPNAIQYAAFKRRFGRGSNPLIYSDTMRSSITYKVQDSGLPDPRLRKILADADNALRNLV